MKQQTLTPEETERILADFNKKQEDKQWNT